MILILEATITDLWDRRHWELALKSDNPSQSYTEMKETMKSLKDEVPIDELTPEQQAWLRNQ